MAKIYLHQHSAYNELLRIVGDQMRILPALVEKDYWIMHVLYGLTKQGFVFELKGGTSLSKGYKIIDRFSEDIDIYIHPPADRKVEENPKKEKQHHINSRREYFDWLAKEIKIEGITSIERDHDFDNDTFTSAGIRLHYTTVTEPVTGLKPGILLEAGFERSRPIKDFRLAPGPSNRQCPGTRRSYRQRGRRHRLLPSRIYPGRETANHHP